MKSSEVKFLKFTETSADNVHYYPLGSVLYWKKVLSTGDSGEPTIVLVAQKSTSAVDTVTITVKDITGASQAHMNAAINALETDLVNVITQLNNGSKNIVAFPGQQGNTLTALAAAGTIPAAYTDSSDSHLTIIVD